MCIKSFIRKRLWTSKFFGIKIQYMSAKNLTTLTTAELRLIANYFATISKQIEGVANQLEQEKLDSADFSGLPTFERGRKYVSSWVSTIQQEASEIVLKDIAALVSETKKKYDIQRTAPAKKDANKTKKRNS
jgi:protoheme ferro-lyase